MFMKLRMCSLNDLFRRFLSHDAKKMMCFSGIFSPITRMVMANLPSKPHYFRSKNNHLFLGFVLVSPQQTSKTHMLKTTHILDAKISGTSMFFVCFLPRSFLWIRCIFPHFLLQPWHPWDFHGIQRPSWPSCNRSAAKPCGIEPWCVNLSDRFFEWTFLQTAPINLDLFTERCVFFLSNMVNHFFYHHFGRIFFTFF